MKLLFTVIQDKDASELLDALMENGFRVTRLSSSGGFLRAGNTTLMLGVENERVDEVLDLIGKICKTREQPVPTPLIPFMRGTVDTPEEKVVVGGASVFCIDVERFEKI
jgi:uncharacterized protein YaaQ